MRTADPALAAAMSLSADKAANQTESDCASRTKRRVPSTASQRMTLPSWLAVRTSLLSRGNDTERTDHPGAAFGGQNNGRTLQIPDPRIAVRSSSNDAGAIMGRTPPKIPSRLPRRCYASGCHGRHSKSTVPSALAVIIRAGTIGRTLCLSDRAMPNQGDERTPCSASQTRARCGRCTQ